MLVNVMVNVQSAAFPTQVPVAVVSPVLLQVKVPSLKYLASQPVKDEVEFVPPSTNLDTYQTPSVIAFVIVCSLISSIIFLQLVKDKNKTKQTTYNN